MNKQELIKKYEEILINGKSDFKSAHIYQTFLRELRQLDEPQKVTVPQFVADWYEANKDNFETGLFCSVDLIPSFYEEGELSEFEEWLVDEHTAPFQTLVNMHQFGYQIEKEKRYYVRFKWIEEAYSYLTLIKHLNTWTLSSIKLDKKFRTEHTKKQLEEAGFGWVFDCPGIEIEEVEEWDLLVG